MSKQRWGTCFWCRRALLVTDPGSYYSAGLGKSFHRACGEEFGARLRTWLGEVEAERTAASQPAQPSLDLETP